MDIFAVPVFEKFLLYSPLHHTSALIDLHALQAIQNALISPRTYIPAQVSELLSILRQPSEKEPHQRQGPINNPFFLGLVTTRRCNLACRYCDFQNPGSNYQDMDLDLVRHAIQAYLRMAKEANIRQTEVHFFGGEPFFNEVAVHFAVECAELLASFLDIRLRFEATTNGVFSKDRCHWIAKYFDTIVLSMDGSPDIQDALRPAKNGRGAANIVIENAKILSENSCDLIIRSCVTSDTATRLPEIATWISREFLPSAVCFETLTPSNYSVSSGLVPPNPWEFACNFISAEVILERSGIQAVLSTVELHKIRDSFCPVGKDALIISPDGSIDACYLLEKDWQIQNLDMHLGNLVSDHIILDPESVQRVRSYNVHTKPLCKHCLCRYHCAGGCHINHPSQGQPGDYDDLCIQTRLITIARLLKGLNQLDLLGEWLVDEQSLRTTVLNRCDRIADEKD